MLLKRLTGIVFLCIALVFGTTAAFGAPFLLGGVQELEDEDWETLISYNSGTKVSTVIPVIDGTKIVQGDLFGGVIKIQATSPIPGTPADEISLDDPAPVDTFTAIFLIKTLSVTGDGVFNNNSNDLLTFGAATLDEWKSVFGSGGLIDVSGQLDIEDLDNLGTGLATGTMALMFDGVSYPNANQNAATLSASASSFVAGARLLYEFGFTDVDGAGDPIAAADEFWTTEGRDAEYPFLANTKKPSNKYSLNITKQWAGPLLLPHNHLLSTGDFDFTGPVQLQGFGSFQETAGQWGLGTDTNLYIFPIPEPATMMLFGLGLLGLSAVSRRKRD